MTLVQRLVGLVVAVLLPLAAVESYNASRLEDEREAQIERDVDRIISALRSEETRLLDVLSSASLEAASAIASRDACAAFVSRSFGGHPSWLSVSVTDASGTVRCAADRGLVGVDLSQNSEVSEALRGEAMAVGDIQSGAFVERPHLPVALGWRQEGASGAVLAAVDLERLALAFSRGPLPTNASLVVADRGGRVVAALPEGGRRVGEILPPGLSQLSRAERSGTSRVPWIDGTDSVVGYAPVAAAPVRGTFLAVGISRSSAMAPLHDASRRARLLFLTTLAVASLLAWWSAVVFIRRPIRVLAETARRLRQGDRGVRANLDGTTELAALGTEFDLMAEAIEAGERRAEMADHEKTRFLAAASHDLRQPLQGALMFAHVVEARSAGNPKALEAIAHLSRALDDMRELLDSLMDISRLDAGVVEPKISDFPIQPLVERVASTFLASSEAKGLRLAAVGGDAVVRSDPTLLGRILRNLVENAIRYTDRGRVLIDCTQSGDMLRIEVRDTGPGIPEDKRGLIWEEFQQLDRNPERDRRAGLGLGLSIVRRLVRLLGHDVRLETEVGKGTTFAVEVPLVSWSTVDHKRPDAGSPMPAAQPDQSVSEGGPVALIIEDDEAILAGLRDAMSAHGFRVLAAASGKQAVSLVTAGPQPEVVVADFRLRDGEFGTDAVVAVREAIGRDLNGVILTGENGTTPEEAARRIGLGLVRKPATVDQILAAVKEVSRGDA